MKESNQKEKKCLSCENFFPRVSGFGAKQWLGRLYCSHVCANKSTRTEDIRKKISISCKENGVGKWMEGRKRPIETTLKQREKMLQLVESGKHNFWKGGISITTRTERANFQGTFAYKQWRREVFERDNYTCQGCEKRGGWIEADHIKSYALFPELRTDLDNGRTLCRPCHILTPNFGSKALALAT